TLLCRFTQPAFGMRRIFGQKFPRNVMLGNFELCLRMTCFGRCLEPCNRLCNIHVRSVAGFIAFRKNMLGVLISLICRYMEDLKLRFRKALFRGLFEPFNGLLPVCWDSLAMDIAHG